MTYGEQDPDFLNHIKEAWPNVENDDEYHNILMSITPFPFAKAETVLDRLKEMHELSGGDFQKALSIVDADMERVLTQREVA